MPFGTSARYDGAQAFVNGQPFNKSNIIVLGETIYSYGYHFPMAFYDTGGLWVNEERYSVTTSKHQSALRGVLAAEGYAPSEQTRTDQNQRFRLWTRDKAA